MIQVVYEWHVPEENYEAFVATWARTTRKIRDSTDGARGSLCLVDAERPTSVLTVAKWDRAEQWRDFVALVAPTALERLDALGVLRSHRLYEQLGDHTV